MVCTVEAAAERLSIHDRALRADHRGLAPAMGKPTPLSASPARRSSPTRSQGAAGQSDGAGGVTTVGSEGRHPSPTAAAFDQVVPPGTPGVSQRGPRRCESPPARPIGARGDKPMAPALVSYVTDTGSADYPVRSVACRNALHARRAGRAGRILRLHLRAHVEPAPIGMFRRSGRSGGRSWTADDAFHGAAGGAR